MPHTLLLADDSVTIRRVIELTFADESVRVVSVSSGREAMASIESAPPDIILADAGMPDVSGYDIAAFVKSRPNLRHIPVILLAGAFEPLDEVRSRKCGSDGVLVKPFEPQMVVTRVRELLSKPVAGPRPVAPATINDIADPTATPARGNSHEPPPLEPAPAMLAADPIFDESLDRLDAAFSHTEAPVPSLDATAATDFANDLRTLRSTDSGGFDRPDFGDWDLPVRGQTEPAARFDSMTAHEPEVAAELFAAPEPEPVVAPMPPPIAMAPRAPAPAPPPPAPTPAPAPAPAPAPIPQPSFAHAVPYQAPPAFAPARPGTPAPALADAFSNLLAAEEGRPYQPLRGAVAEALPNAQMTDADMDVIVDKVIARLGSGVRGAVIDLAERLVKAEIDRLKALR